MSSSTLAGAARTSASKCARAPAPQLPIVRSRRRQPVLLPRAAAAPDAGSQPPLAGAATQRVPEQQQQTAAGPPPNVQELAAAAHDVRAFRDVLLRLADSGAATEAHVVAAWGAQRRSRALRVGAGGGGHALLQALATLERLTRQQLVALSPDQLGYVFRCYVLAGGASKPLLAALQRTACTWRGEDYGAAGLAELAWALASCGQQLPDSCRQLLHEALHSHGPPGSSSWEHEERPAAARQMASQQTDSLHGSFTAERGQAGAADGPTQQLQQQPQRDWQAWFRRAPPSCVALLLWAAADLGVRPGAACLDAAAAALLRGQRLAALQPKALLALLWSLATLRAARQRPLIQAIAQRLADWFEESMDGREEQRGSSVGALGDLFAAPAAGWHGAAPRPQAGQLCTALWACGQLRHAEPRLLRPVAALLHDRVGELAPAEAARALWGLAQLGYCPAPLFSAVAERLQAPGQLAGFSVRQLAMLTYAFAALDFFPGQDCMDALADACLAARRDFDPRALSHVLWNMSRLGHVDEPFYAAFVPAILPSISAYGPAELADLARVYAKHGLNPELALESAAAAGDAATGVAAEAAAGAAPWDKSKEAAAAAGAAGAALARSSGEASDDSGGGEERQTSGSGRPDGSATLFDAFAAQTLACIEGADIQDILRILTAFHEMGLQPDKLLAAVEAWADRRLRALSPQALALALWSFARLGSGSPRLPEAAAACAEQQLDAFSPGQLAQVAWALAKLRWPAPRVLRHAGAQLAARGDRFGDKEASNVLWALASEGEALPAEDLDRIAASLQPRLRGFGPQSLANIAWAYATLGHAPPDPFLRLLGDAARPQLSAFEPQGLSLLVWSLASLGCRHNSLLLEIMHLCEDSPALLRQFEGQNIANLLWGYCTTGFNPSASFLRALAKEARLRVCDLKTQELFNVAWAFAQLGHHPVKLFDAIALEAAPRACALTPQELSGLLWALAKCRHGGPGLPPLLHAVEHELSAREPAFEDRHLGITAWAFGQLGHVPAAPALAALCEGARRRAPGMSARTLATLVGALADMQLQMERRQRWQRAEQQRGQPAEQAADQAEQRAADQQQQGAAEQQAAQQQQQQPARQASERLVSMALVESLAERAVHVLPRLQPFEFAGLLRALTALGSRATATLLLRAAPGSAAHALLGKAVEHAVLPAKVELLWAMAACGCYPEEAFEALAARLAAIPREFRFSQPALAMLGDALAAMPLKRRQQLKLRHGLALAAAAAAAQAATAPRVAAAAGSDSRGGSDSGDGSSGENEGEDVAQQEQQLRQRLKQPAAREDGARPACVESIDGAARLRGTAEFLEKLA